MSQKILMNEVHLWWCDPESISNEETLSRYRSVLSGQEAERYQRLLHEKDKHSYLVSHAMLRYALSQYCSTAPADWQFTAGEYGKPQLAQLSAATDLQFNLTHTEKLSACVVTSNKKCGIDAEYIRRGKRLDQVAKRMFAKQEQETIARGGDTTLFFDYWTLHEAYVKALGTGLAGSTDQYYFSIEEHDAHIHYFQPSLKQNNWYFKLFEPTPKHRLAIAIESVEPVELVLHDFHT